MEQELQLNAAKSLSGTTGTASLLGELVDRGRGLRWISRSQHLGDAMIDADYEPLRIAHRHHDQSWAIDGCAE
ncbi:MAG: hypothetical protein ACLR8Y_03735 [Alistipes indistinctus]